MFIKIYRHLNPEINTFCLDIPLSGPLMRLSQFKFAQISGTVYQNSLSVILVYGVLFEGKPNVALLGHL